MKLHLFFSLFLTFLLTACGGGSSSTATELLSLNLNGATVTIANANFEAGTRPKVTIPALDVSTAIGDGTLTVTQTLNGTTVETGVVVNAQEGNNTVIYTITETAGDEESTTLTKTFTRTSVDTIAPDAPTLNRVTEGVIDGDTTNIEVTGEVGAKVLINGVATTPSYFLDSNGYALVLVPLVEGANNISVSLQDVGGLTGLATTVEITRDRATDFSGVVSEAGLPGRARLVGRILDGDGGIVSSVITYTDANDNILRTDTVIGDTLNESASAVGENYSIVSTDAVGNSNQGNPHTGVLGINN